MADLEKLIPAVIERGKTDAVALQDAMTLMQALEETGAVFVQADGNRRGEKAIFNEGNFKKAHDFSKLYRRAAAELMKVKGSFDIGFELYYRAHLFDAPYSFDSFMLYDECKMPKEKQFWLPRRKQLLPVAQCLQDMEDGNLDEEFINLPARVGKTQVVQRFLKWIILRDSERTNLYSSFAGGVCDGFYNGLLTGLTDIYTYAWMDIFPNSKVVATNAKLSKIDVDRVKTYPSFTARSIDANLNGSCDCNGYLVIDDIHEGISEAISRERLAKKWSAIQNNLIPRGKESAKIIWIGTRWATEDAIGRRLDFLENDESAKRIRKRVFNIPALDENDESNFDYLYGVGFSTQKYRERRAEFERSDDMASWYAQYQGQPIDRDGSVFSPDSMRFYNGVLPAETKPDRVFMPVDPAWGGGDYVSAPVLVQYGDDIYVPDVVYDNSDKSVTVPKVVHAAIKNCVQNIRVEATKATASYTEEISKLLTKQGKKLSVQSSVANWTYTGKESRILEKAPEIVEHMIFLENGRRSPEYQKFMNNVFAFKSGGKNKNDDAPDSLAQGIDMAYRKHRKGRASSLPS